MNMDRQDAQDYFESLTNSLVSRNSFVFDFWISTIDRKADLDSGSLLKVVFHVESELILYILSIHVLFSSCVETA